MNEYLAREIRRKYYLQNVAGSSKKFEDFESYRKQRETAKRLCILARDAYFRNNDGEETNWLPRLAVEATQTQLTCENCDREFYNEKVSILFANLENFENVLLFFTSGSVTT